MYKILVNQGQKDAQKRKASNMAYTGFKKLEGKLAGKVANPAAVAAKIGREKYGKEKFQKAAAAGKTMRGMKAK